ncbi:hypothetical protein [Shimia sp.]|uniref:hypothetical protein n=1 Tax=Shimia sp. TaxID=1954381 RepID=UPI003296B19D
MRESLFSKKTRVRTPAKRLGAPDAKAVEAQEFYAVTFAQGLQKYLPILILLNNNRNGADETKKFGAFDSCK